MTYQIQCRRCRTDTWAGNIADLIALHTDDRGRLVCAMCGASECYIHRISGVGEKEFDEPWNGYIKGVIQVAGRTGTYTPYVFLTADTADGEITEIRFSYYRDPGPNGQVKGGPGPGGAPALTQTEFFKLLDRLRAFGIIKPSDVEVLGSHFRRDSPSYAFA